MFAFIEVDCSFIVNVSHQLGWLGACFVVFTHSLACFFLIFFCFLFYFVYMEWGTFIVQMKKSQVQAAISWTRATQDLGYSKEKRKEKCNLGVSQYKQLEFGHLQSAINTQLALDIYV